MVCDDFNPDLEVQPHYSAKFIGPAPVRLKQPQAPLTEHCGLGIKLPLSALHVPGELGNGEVHLIVTLKHVRHDFAVPQEECQKAFVLFVLLEFLLLSNQKNDILIEGDVIL